MYLPKIRFLSQGVWAVGEGQKIKKPKNGVFFHKTEIFWFFKKFVCLYFQLKTTCKKSDSYLLWVFHNRLFNYWKKSKKAHNSVKKQNFKKQKIFFLRIHNTSVHAKNQVSRLNGMGSRRRTNKNTPGQTKDWSPMKFLFFIFIFIFSSAV